MTTPSVPDDVMKVAREAESSPSDDLLAFSIRETLGDRCPDFDAGCYTCQAWSQYDDLIERRAEIDALRAEVSRLTKRVEEAAVVPAYDDIHVPADIEEFGERHGIPVFGTATYRNGYLAGFRAARDWFQKNGGGNG